MPKLTINDIEVEVEPGTSVLQAAEQLGIEIPRFCFHDRLSVPANCRMCLVEVKGGPPKPQASCALACGEGMEVYTDTNMVHRARKGVMEFLLINHPLDCPICDQGGECDLQDQAVAYGYDRSRYYEQKRAVKDKEMGPLVKTVMTRCIQCTRCVRFADEIAGVGEIGLLNRGEDVEIGMYVEKACESELSGNLVDVCPVGALTNKPYAFTARPWELRKTETIDVLDAVGSNITVGVRSNQVMRVLPRLNEAVNEEWINDKTRYAVDGLKRQRLDKPFVRKNGKLEEASWEEAFIFAANKIKGLKGDEIAALAGDLVDVESTYALKELMTALGSKNLECRVDGARYDVSEPCGYRFNTTIEGIESADAVLLIGCNPRTEAAMINARIRKAWLKNKTKIAVIGDALDLNYPYHHAGADITALDDMVKVYTGKVKADRPMVVVGMGALVGKNGPSVQMAVREAAEKLGCIKDDWNGFNILHTAGGRMGALSLGFTPEKEFTFNGLKAVWLHGVDTDMVDDIPKDTFVIYQGHHGDKGAARADVIFPGLSYVEKNALYVNTEGRVQMARAATTPLGDAKEDWKIIRAFSEALDKPLKFNTLHQLRHELCAKYPMMNDVGEITSAEWTSFGAKGDVKNVKLTSCIDNFYQTCVVSRASETMAECTKTFCRPKLAEAAE